MSQYHWIQTSLDPTAASAPYLHWDSDQVKETLTLSFLLCKMGKLYPLHHSDKQGNNFDSRPSRSGQCSNLNGVRERRVGWKVCAALAFPAAVLLRAWCCWYIQRASRSLSDALVQPKQPASRDATLGPHGVRWPRRAAEGSGGQRRAEQAVAGSVFSVRERDPAADNGHTEQASPGGRVGFPVRELPSCACHPDSAGVPHTPA